MPAERLRYELPAGGAEADAAAGTAHTQAALPQRPSQAGEGRPARGASGSTHQLAHNIIIHTVLFAGLLLSSSGLPVVMLLSSRCTT